MISNLAVSGQVSQDDFTFSSFEIGGNGQNIALNWTVNKVEKSNYFEVERSIGGKKFKTIMIVLGPNPSKRTEESFNSSIKNSIKNKRYYRLKHINEEGIITFSPIKTPEFNQ